MSKWPGCSKKLQTTFGGLSRSELMSRIRSSGNATTEVKFLRLMRAAGIKGWRRDYPLPGKPDFVFSKVRLAVFVDGCFWHGHHCGRALVPKRNASAWREKLLTNRRRDLRVARQLRLFGWKVLRVWECRLAKWPSACVQRIRRALAQ